MRGEMILCSFCVALAEGSACDVPDAGRRGKGLFLSDIGVRGAPGDAGGAGDVGSGIE